VDNELILISRTHQEGESIVAYYVEVRNLVKVFKSHASRSSTVRAVDGISFGVREGELITLLGPSGCGKTTTLRLVGGFEIPTEGDIFIDGVRVNDQPPNARPTSMVFQSYALFPHMTVFENIAYGLKNKRLPSDEIKTKVLETLEIVGLQELEKRYPGQLSGGQQQRVALARAIVMEPKVLLLDEPLSNLDAKLREQMRVELKKLQTRLRITSIYVTHDQLEAMTLSDRVVVMKDGKIVQIDSPERIYRFPTNKFVAGFIGKANFLKGKIGKVWEESCELVMTNGMKLEADLPKGHNFEVGEEVLIVVRPEGISFCESSQAHIVGHVISRIYTGGAASFEVETDQGVMTVEVTNPLALALPSIDENVGLSFSRTAVAVVKAE